MMVLWCFWVSDLSNGGGLGLFELLTRGGLRWYGYKWLFFFFLMGDNAYGLVFVCLILVFGLSMVTRCVLWWFDLPTVTSWVAMEKRWLHLGCEMGRAGFSFLFTESRNIKYKLSRSVRNMNRLVQLWVGWINWIAFGKIRWPVGWENFELILLSNSLIYVGKYKEKYYLKPVIICTKWNYQ